MRNKFDKLKEKTTEACFNAFDLFLQKENDCIVTAAIFCSSTNICVYIAQYLEKVNLYIRDWRKHNKELISLAELILINDGL